MIVIPPLDIINGLLTSSSIPEPDASAGEVVWTSGTYNVGDRRILLSTHLVYEALATTTTSPDVGLLETPPKWIVVGYTNRYRMFDQVNSSQSTAASPLIVEITSAKGFDSAAIFNATGLTSVRYQVHTSGGVLAYDKTIEAVDNSDRVDWLTWLYLPIVQQYKFFVNDIPKAANQKLTATITGAGSVSVGNLVVGSGVNLAVTCYGGTGFDFIDLSRVDENDFGDFVIVPRADYKLVNYDIRTDKSRIDFVVNQIKSLKRKPCVWSGTGKTDDSTTVFGYVRKFQQNIDSPVKCTATMQIREIT